MTTANKITGAQLLVKALQREGVQNVFLLAGDHVLTTLDVMADTDIRMIDTRHEQAAVHMADAYGRITGQPGVAMYTTPGFANAVPGLASAFHSESPVLSISGSAPMSELGRGAMQEIDQTGMAAPVTKGAWTVTDPRRIPQMVAHALRVAYSGRRGPVHLTVPVNVQDESVDERDVDLHLSVSIKGTSSAVGSPEQIRNAVALLRDAERPLIVAGSAATYYEPAGPVQKLVETAHLPIMTEGDARGLVADSHPYCYGFFDSGLNEAARLLREADVVLLLGRKQDIILGYATPPTIAAEAKVIQVDPSESAIGQNRDVTIGITGDVSAVVEQMADEASKHSWTKRSGWLARLQAERDAQVAALESMASEEAPMHAMWVHKALESLLEPDDVLVFDGGDFCHFGRAYLPANTPISWWYLPPLGMLGSGVPTALAAKVAHPDRRVVCLTGDGSFGFNGMELDTAVRHNLNITVIIGNDAAWGIDRQIQLGVFGRPVATDLLPSRYDKMMEGFGGHSEHVTDPADVSGAIERALNVDKPSLLNVEVQRAISPRAQAAIDRWNSEIVQPF